MSSESPTGYNAAADLIERNLHAGRGAKTAFIDDRGQYSYAELAERVSRFANLVRRLGIHPEQRILLCLHDTIDFPTAFLGAIKAGAVPVAVNTQLSAAEFAFMAADSRARAVVVSAPLLPVMKAALATLPGPRPALIVSGGDTQEHSLAALLAEMPAASETAPTHPDEPCFWLYSSGSTGRPKGTVHIHSSLMQTAELYAVPVLGIDESDIVFSAAKLFFAYGLGNALTFPLAVGATSVLMAERPTPAAVSRVLREHRPTIFYGVPTLYNAMLAGNDLPPRDELALRRCVSAGEPLPQEIGRRWSARIGVDILDGIGSTEMLHIFLSNWPDGVRYGTTGRPIPGYRAENRRRGGKARPPRRNRRPVGQRADQRRLLLEQSRALPCDVHGPVDPHRRQIFRGRRRLLRLLRPQRRHDEGQRHVRLAGRGRSGARRTRGRARGGRRRCPGRGRSGQAEGVRGRQTREFVPTRNSCGRWRGT